MNAIPPSAFVDALPVATRAVINEAVRSLDFNRASQEGRSLHGPHHKEWLHYCLHTAELDIVVNLSGTMVGAGDGHGADKVERAFRVITMVRDKRDATSGWRADFGRLTQTECEMPGGEVGARFGQSHAWFRRGLFDLRLDVPGLGLHAELALLPMIIPTQTLNTEVHDGPPHHWAMVPRLLANGSLAYEGERFEVRDAPAYHDHNWGTFRFGDDFSWEWGYAIPSDPACPWTVVTVRFSDAAHNNAHTQVLFVWKGPRLFAVFSRHEVRFEHHGLAKPRSMVKVPKVMALLRPGNATDVPARYVVHGESSAGAVTLEFVPDDIAQIMVPNDGVEEAHRRGMTIIHETAGAFRVHGEAHGEEIAFCGEGIFEFLSR